MIDNNGKLTCATWGQIQEPICFYNELADLGLSTLHWYNVKFAVVSDITGIIIKLDQIVL